MTNRGHLALNGIEAKCYGYFHGKNNEYRIRIHRRQYYELVRSDIWIAGVSIYVHHVMGTPEQVTKKLYGECFRTHFTYSHFQSRASELKEYSRTKLSKSVHGSLDPCTILGFRFRTENQKRPGLKNIPEQKFLNQYTVVYPRPRFLDFNFLQ